MGHGSFVLRPTHFHREASSVIYRRILALYRGGFSYIRVKTVPLVVQPAPTHGGENLRGLSHLCVKPLHLLAEKMA